MKTLRVTDQEVNKEIEAKRKYLNEYINLMDQKDILFLYELFHIYKHNTKDNLVELFDTEKTIDTNKTDSAYPVDYFRKIQDVYPNIDKGMYIYNYTNNSFGSLYNVNNLIANQILNFFSNITLNISK